MKKKDLVKVDTVETNGDREPVYHRCSDGWEFVCKSGYWASYIQLYDVKFELVSAGADIKSSYAKIVVQHPDGSEFESDVVRLPVTIAKVWNGWNDPNPCLKEFEKSLGEAQKKLATHNQTLEKQKRLEESLKIFEK